MQIDGKKYFLYIRLFIQHLGTSVRSNDSVQGLESRGWREYVTDSLY